MGQVIINTSLILPSVSAAPLDPKNIKWGIRGDGRSGGGLERCWQPARARDSQIDGRRSQVTWHQHLCEDLRSRINPSRGIKEMRAFSGFFPLAAPFGPVWGLILGLFTARFMHIL